MATTQAPTDQTVQDQLDAVAFEIADLELRLEQVNEQIGAAYVRQRKGDKKAQSDLGKLGMKRSGIERDLQDLKLTRTALQEQAREWEAGEAARNRDRSLAELERLTTEARDLERTLGEQIVAAARTAKQLRDTGQAWGHTRATAGKAGGDVSAHGPRPAPPARLFHLDVIDTPERVVAQWRNQYIERTPIPAREPTGADHERTFEREELARQRRERSEAEPKTFTISDLLHQKRGA